MRKWFFVSLCVWFLSTPVFAQWYGYGWDPVSRWQYDMFSAVNYWGSPYSYRFYPGNRVGLGPWGGAVVGAFIGGTIGERKGAAIGAVTGGVGGYWLSHRRSQKYYPSRDLITNPTPYEADIYQRQRYLRTLRPGQSLSVPRHSGWYRAILHVRVRGGGTVSEPAPLQPTDYGWRVVY